MAQQIIRLDAHSKRWSGARLISFLLLLALSSIALFAVGAWLFWVSLFGLSALFSWIIIVHQRFERSITRHRARYAFTLAQIARMKLDWSAIPPPSESNPRYDHPFEADLDLVGERSLHQLVDLSVTQGGSRLLREWLTTTVPDAAEIAQRQALVRELMPRSLWRAQLHLNGTQAVQAAVKTALMANPSTKLNGQLLVTWFGQSQPVAPLRRWTLILAVVAGINLVLVALHWLALAAPLWPYSLALYSVLTLYAIGNVAGTMRGEDTFRAAADLQGVMKGLAALFHQLEATSYRDTPRLAKLCQPFLDKAERPSRYLRQLSHIVNATGIRGNPVIWLLLNGVVPWDMFFAWRLAACKSAVAGHIDGWLATWHELEALSGLANLHYLNPHYVLPMIDADALLHPPGFMGDPSTPERENREADEADKKEDEETLIEPGAKGKERLLAAEGMGHPLLPDVEAARPKVRNNFVVDQLGAVAVITGSNMAGKSTFLKALGLNLALAYAGGPVDAARWQAARFRLFTCIKVSDSVTDGISYFYAEVRRLKALLQELERPHALPLFFCIDEIFRGTNNRERLVGSQAYIQALSGQNGIGLISTHDLELIKLAEENPLITNYHFRDEIEGEHMVFDYLLRPGPSPTTNALRIMKAAGLPV